MLRLFNRKRRSRFHEDESGPTAVEYAVMIALIVVVCVGAVKSLSTATKGSLGCIKQRNPIRSLKLIWLLYSQGESWHYDNRFGLIEGFKEFLLAE